MQNRLAGLCCFLHVFACALSAGAATAEPVDWVMIEARLVPQTCSKPMECIPKSSLILRNLAFMEQAETRDITMFLNRIATIRGISDTTTDALNLSTPALVNKFHEQTPSDKHELLRDHPGVYFDSKTLDSVPESEGFSDFLRTQLTAAGVRFLAKDEWQKMPGKPKLTVRYSRHRESEGCIIPFSVNLSITEEAVLVRSPGLKTTSTIWSGTVRENLANRNYKPTSAIRELVDKFLCDWTSAQT